MLNLLQQTVMWPVSFHGVGVHSGQEVNLKVLPAPENTGIKFIRTDLSGNNVINASYDNVVDTKLCTVIANEYGAKVSTIEHLMSALWGCWIDNAIIEIDGEEVPIMDGSAESFVAAFKRVGVREQTKQRKFIKITQAVKVNIADKFIELKPSDEFKINYEIEFAHQAIGKQVFCFANNHTSYSAEISRARTFGFAKELAILQSMGLAKGASLDNAIGIDDNGIMNQEGLRYDDEFVRHKVLDCIGDLYLAGARLICGVSCYKGSHELNNLVLRQLFSDRAYYQISPIDASFIKVSHGVYAQSFAS